MPPSLFMHKLLEERQQRQGKSFNDEKNIQTATRMSDDEMDDQREEAEVGKVYRGSIVTNIESEVSKRHMVWQTREDGEQFPTFRVRKSITLENGMILIEDEYRTNYNCEGEFKEIEYNEPESPTKAMKKLFQVEKKPKKKKKDKKSPDKSRDSETIEGSNGPSSAELEVPLFESEEEEIEDDNKLAAAVAEAAEIARREAEEDARRKAEEEEAERARKQAEEEEAAERARQKQAEEDELAAKQRAAAAAEEEMERQRKKEMETKLKASQEALAQRKKEAAVKRASLQAEAEAKKEADRRRQLKRSKWEPAAIWVYSPGKAKSIQEEMTEEEKERKRRNKNKIFIGVWSFGAGPDEEDQAQSLEQEEQSDDEYYKGWKPLKDVIVYPPGYELPPDIIMSKRKKGVVDGLWCYNPGSEPSDDDDDWKPDNMENILVCPPGKMPPRGIKVQGKWACKSTNGKWPPLIQPPQKALVYPKARLPTKAIPYLDAAATISSGKKQVVPKVRKICFGVWSHGNMDPGDDVIDRWKPQPVLMYEDGDDPVGRDEEGPRGQWRCAVGAEPDEEGNWDPNDVRFYVPGVTPPKDEISQQHPGGTWTVDPASENVQWPPPCVNPPKKATVYPQARIPSRKLREKGECIGTWMFSSGNSNDWMPQDVLMYEPGSEPTDLESSSLPHGEWTYAAGAEPDEEGNWNPEDICFYVPGESPPENTKNQPGGKWTISLEATNVQWPPSCVKPPKNAVVYPPGRIPKSRKKGTCAGKWSFAPGSEESQSGKKWSPKSVLMYEAGHEPKRVEMSSAPHGEWRVARGAKQDGEGNWNPEDVCFYVPGATPEVALKNQPGGIWMSENKVWPPPLVKTPQKATVYPKGKMPDSVDEEECVGKWMFAPGSDMAERIDSWNPQQVILYEQGSEPAGLEDSSTPHGRWGYAPGAEPDMEGNWNPDDVWFFASDETPPDDDDWQAMGVWTFAPGLPPEALMTPPGKMKARISVQKSPPWKSPYVPSGFDDGEPKPKMIWVYPEEKLPTRGRLMGKTGIWAYGPDSKHKKIPKEAVHIYEGGILPDNLDKSIPNGLWGCPHDAVPDGNGDWKPEDMRFCPPGETPPTDWVPKGKWIFPPTWLGARRMDWYHFDYSEGQTTRESQILNLDSELSDLNFVDNA